MEFAIVAPVFFAFLLGMIEIGRGVMVQQIITSASREGARQAVLDGATTSAVNSLVSSYLTGASISAGGMQVTITPSIPTVAGYSGPVTVKVSVPFSQVNWGVPSVFLNGATIAASTTMQREGIQ